jgi:hypothetical protein
MRIHNVFHVSLLKAYVRGEREQPPPPELTADGGVWYNAEAILDHRERKYGRGRARREFLVKWEGYPHEHNTWEPEANVKDCDAYTEYWAKKHTAK